MAENPPYSEIYGIAKHGSDEELLKARDDIRWLALWAESLHDKQRALLSSSKITLHEESWNEELGFFRVLEITAKIESAELQEMLLTVLGKS